MNLSDEEITALTKRTQDGGTEVVEAKAGKGFQWCKFELIFLVLFLINTMILYIHSLNTYDPTRHLF